MRNGDVRSENGTSVFEKTVDAARAIVTIAPPVHHLRSRWGTIIVLLSVVDPAWFLIANGALHILRRDLSPVTHFISEYAVGRYGWLMASALVILGCGTLSLSVGITTTLGKHPVGRVGTAILGVSGIATVLIGLFRTDIDGQPATLAGAIHGRAALIAISFEAISVLVLTPVFFRNARWRPFRAVSGVLAVAVVLSIALYAVLPHGAGERLIVYTLVLWLFFAGVRLRKIVSWGGRIRPLMKSGGGML